MPPLCAAETGQAERPPYKTGETASHLELNALLCFGAENGYSIAALEVPSRNAVTGRCRRYRPQKSGTLGQTVVSMQTIRPDLHRDDCRSAPTLTGSNRFTSPADLEKHLRVHYPTLRTGDSLFPEWDAHNFAAIEHRGYRRVIRELTALQRQLRDGRKFEKLARYACANLFYLVVPNELLREPEAPLGWGLLVEREGALNLRRKPTWRESSEQARLRVLQKIAAAGTRQLNRRLKIEL